MPRGLYPKWLIVPERVSPNAAVVRLWGLAACTLKLWFSVLDKVIRSRNGRAPGKMCFTLSSCLWEYEGASQAVLLMEECMKCGKDGGPLWLSCSALLNPSPRQLSTYIYMPCQASTREQKDKMGCSRTLVLLEPPAYAVGSCLSSGRESGSCWQRWPGTSPGWILLVAKGGALMNSHQQSG